MIAQKSVVKDASDEDFFVNFQAFFKHSREITNVRFNYMRELYALQMDSFPDDVEVLNIQQNNKLNQQAQQGKLKKNWTDDDRKVLIWLVGKYSAKHKRDLKQLSDNDWNIIASMMPRRDGFKCKQKWLQMLKLPLQQAPWTTTEDELIKSIIRDFQSQSKGNKWSQIATTFNKIRDTNVHRNGKQCRERWNNHLNPTINRYSIVLQRNPWQLSEDLDLMKAAISNGKKWALISKKLHVPRSENSVKNRFNCLLRKERSQKTEEQEPEPEQSNEELSHDELKLIHAIMKKIEWRIQQSGNHRNEEPIKEEHMDLLKKVKIENNLVKTMDTISLIVQDQSPDDDNGNLLPCLVDKEKNIIYIATPEQFQIYLNKTSETTIQGQENLSNQNSVGSFIYDPKLFRSYVMFQSNDYPKFPNLGNFQSINSYPYQMSCYPSQMNLMLQR